MTLESAESIIAEPRTRMISFRVTSEEHSPFRQISASRGLRNVSEVVRHAVSQLLSERASQRAHHHRWFSEFMDTAIFFAPPDTIAARITYE